jgi:hypothetical protein
MDQTFTDFMVRCMENEDDVASAILVVRRKEGSIGYRVFQQEVADTLGVLRVAALSVENDLISNWREER